MYQAVEICCDKFIVFSRQDGAAKMNQIGKKVEISEK